MTAPFELAQVIVPSKPSTVEASASVQFSVTSVGSNVSFSAARAMASAAAVLTTCVPPCHASSG